MADVAPKMRTRSTTRRYTGSSDNLYTVGVVTGPLVPLLPRIFAGLLGVATAAACAQATEEPPNPNAAASGTGGVSAGGAASSAGGHGGGGAPPTQGGASPIECGNGVAEPGEACDGDDHGGKTCLDYGFAGGALGCNEACHAIGKDCTVFESCADDKDNDRDALVDCDDAECVEAAACTDPCSISILTDGHENVQFLDVVGNSTALVSTCSEPGDRVSVVKVVPAAVGDLRLRSNRSNIAVRTDCADPAMEIACEVPTMGPSTPNTGIRLYHVIPGEVYWVLVHSAEGEDPSLYIDMLDSEMICDDGIDDDYDGLIDCDDGDCPPCESDP